MKNKTKVTYVKENVIVQILFEKILPQLQLKYLLIHDWSQYTFQLL